MVKKRGIFLGKKANLDIESYFIIIKFVILMAAILAMSAYVYSVVSDTFFQKMYFSRDIAFTINTLYSAPGSIYHEYTRKNLEKFEIDFSQNKVGLRENDETKKGLAFNYFYASDLDYGLEKDLIKDSNKIFLQKLPYNFEIKSESNTKLKSAKCQGINTADYEWNNKLFLIDPAYTNDEEKNRIIGSIGLSLYSKFGNKETTRDSTSSSDINEQTRKEPKIISDLIEKSDVIISINMGDYQNGDNSIKIYTSSIGDSELVNKRKKLGCLILNELVSDKELDKIFMGSKMISVNPDYISKDYAEMLGNDKLSVVIEIGNIQSEGAGAMDSADIITKIADKIYEGAKKYYG